MSTTMSGLRVYINSPSTAAASSIAIEAASTAGNRVYYSRRGSGPVYRWLYEEKLAHWRALRMPTSDLNSREFSNASWKSVPETLQVQLGAHYLD